MRQLQRCKSRLDTPVQWSATVGQRGAASCACRSSHPMSGEKRSGNSRHGMAVRLHCFK